MTQKYRPPDSDNVNFTTESYVEPDSDNTNFTFEGLELVESSEQQTVTVSISTTTETTKSTDNAKQLAISTNSPKSTEKTISSDNAKQLAISTNSPKSTETVISPDNAQQLSVTTNIPQTTETTQSIDDAISKQIQISIGTASIADTNSDDVNRDSGKNERTIDVPDTVEFPIKIVEETDICVDDVDNLADVRISSIVQNPDCEITTNIISVNPNNDTQCMELTYELNVDCKDSADPDKLDSRSDYSAEFDECQG